MTQTTVPVGTTEAAAAVGVHRDTLIRWADAGKIKCWRTPGGQRRFDLVELEALLQGQAK